MEIHDLNQPLIISKNEKTGNDVVLIPELCNISGLSDKQRANFGLMKELSSVLHKNAAERVKQTKDCIAELLSQEKVKKNMEKWQMAIESDPVSFEGQ